MTFINHARPFFILLTLLFLFMPGSGAASADIADDDAIPSALDPWRAWVLHGHEEALCPSAYDDGDAVRCNWPTRLDLTVADDGAWFEQRWLVFARGWAALPGGSDLWPDAVTLDGRPAAVINRDNRPMVRLEPGEHQITGRFFWKRLPEMMQVSPQLGLLSLTINGQTTTSPLFDEHGRLWLQKSDSEVGQQDRVDVTVFRLIEDDIPMRVQTLVRLIVSGKSRELALDHILPTNAIAMEINSTLPVRINSSGGLLVQARAGHWDIMVHGRLPGPSHALTLEANSPYGDEIWCFAPRHDLRTVEIKDVPPIEPSQTELPQQWRSLHAFLVKPGGRMTFYEIRRGDTQPAPDRLTLHRMWWLDIDGGGFTVHDTISGVLSRSWRLSMNAPMVLGRVAVDGLDQMITRWGENDQRAGVELRHGQLNLRADARLIEHNGDIPAIGWDQDFAQVGGLLHLPPGWRLFAAAGVDQVSDTWLQRWSLLDFFVVLIIALAFLKLKGRRWSLAALAAMTLIYHEPGAPKYVWLHLLPVLALLPMLPKGWFKRLVAVWGIAAGVVLLTTAVVFIVQQARWGIYPQLAPHDSMHGRTDFVMKEPPAPATAPDQDVSQDLPRTAAPAKKRFKESVSLSGAGQDTAGWHQDPDAAVPTGPGLPDWQWRSLKLVWSGPVSGDQVMRLYLLSPTTNLLLALARCFLLIILIWGVFDWRKGWRKWHAGLGITTPALLCLLVWGAAADLRADQTPLVFPPAELLGDLRQRLLEKPDCLPACADVSRMEVLASEESLQITLKVHAARQTAVPLPVNRQSWNPDQIMLDNAPMGGLARDAQGRLWGLVPAGLHTVILLGTVEHTDIVQIPLPLRPHAATFTGKGWRVRGISEDGRTGAGIELTREDQLQGADGTAIERQGGALPVFLHVERALALGLTWRVSTTVRRLTPPGAPVVVSVPLLAGESVTTGGFQVDQGQVIVTLPSDKVSVSYSSTLPVTSSISLTAPKTVPWTETWILDASPVWHCAFEGIAAIHHQDAAGQWKPQWRPWPGERVVIDVTRPKALDGQLMTIDSAELALTPGQRFGKAELNINLRTSRGGQHTIELPDKANLQQIAINGKSLPIRQDGRHITVPLQPGSRKITLQWLHLSPFSNWYKAPEVKIGGQAVNARVTVHMPSKRWVLMVGGPRWGPAVLFWSYLTVILLAAVALGRISLTPLKTWQWVLLALGLTQTPPSMALIIVGWLLVLGLREKKPMPEHWLPFNALQVALMIWTGVALIFLFTAVKAGLVGQPEMQIAGNGSTHLELNWTQDHSGDSLPRPWVLSLPAWVFSLLMLAWSLWLAAALLRWLKWGWRCFNTGGMWRAVMRKKVGETKKVV